MGQVGLSRGEIFFDSAKKFYALSLKPDGRAQKSSESVMLANHSRGWHASCVDGLRMKKGTR
jgi:hypothetical protein